MKRKTTLLVVILLAQCLTLFAQNSTTLKGGSKTNGAALFQAWPGPSRERRAAQSRSLPEISGTYSFKKFHLPANDLVDLFKSQGDDTRLHASVYTATVGADVMAAATL